MSAVFYYNVKQLKPIFLSFGIQYPDIPSF